MKAIHIPLWYLGLGFAYAIAEYALSGNPNFVADSTDQTPTGILGNVFLWPYLILENKGL